MYLVSATRPDIAYATNYLSHFIDCYGITHWKATRRILRYLEYTKENGIMFQRNKNTVIGYADEDWGGNIVDRKSYSGFVFTLAGGAITWQSRKQLIVALSSTEAEYIALAEATKEGIYLRRLLNELGITVQTMKLKCDNQGAQKLTRNSTYHNRTKNIDISFVRCRASGSMRACYAAGPGSIPGRDKFLG